MRFLVLQGPNLNRLGKRDPARYGVDTLPEIEAKIDVAAKELGVEVEHFQANHEGFLIDYIQAHSDAADGIILNPAGLTKAGYSLANAIEDAGLPLAIVHLSQLFAHDHANRQDVFAGIASVYIAGAGWRGYCYAIHALHGRLQ